jgi:LysR family transcriptional regulator, cell division regulator
LCLNFFAVLLVGAPASHALRSTILDAKDLRVFEVVARCEGMKRAAAELNTVQSNVTTRIRNLEQDLGVSLFERRPNGLKLTPAGTRLLPYAYEVRAAISNARRAVEDVGKPTGPLVIGSRKSTSALHLSQILSKYVSMFPDVEVRIRTETSPLLTEAVIERRIEAAFVCDPVEHHDLVSELIFDEELAILTAPDIRDLRALSAANTKIIVLGQGSLYEQQLKAVLLRRGIVVKRKMELGTVENIMDCVSAGQGITLLPKALANYGSKYRPLVAHSVMDEECRVQTFFIRRRDGYVSSALSAFLSCTQAYAEAIHKERGLSKRRKAL